MITNKYYTFNKGWGQWMNKTEINKAFGTISGRTDELYDFINLFHECINQPKDYGIGELISMVEVHTLDLIDDNPGITQGEIAKRRGRTLGAVCQMISKLVKKGLVQKRKEEGNAKIVHLYVTDKGEQLSMMHRLNDIKEMNLSLQMLLESCTMEELRAFTKVAMAYRTYFMQLNEIPSQ